MSSAAQAGVILMGVLVVLVAWRQQDMKGLLGSLSGFVGVVSMMVLPPCWWS